jgi:hypothetical protein
MSLILGYAYSDFTEFNVVFRDLEFLLAYFVKHLGFFSFCLFLGILVKRSAFALGFLVLWQFFEGFVRGMVRWKVLDSDGTDTLMSFFPLQAMFNLIDEPFTRLGAVKSIADQLDTSLELDYAVTPLKLLIVLAWTAFFIWASYKLLKRRDL